jgi:hypothetical protein
VEAVAEGGGGWLWQKEVVAGGKKIDEGATRGRRKEEKMCGSSYNAALSGVQEVP